MHRDLARLLEVQASDRLLGDLDARARAIGAEREELDAAVQRARGDIDSAKRMAEDTARRKEECERRVETHRTHQERRRQRLDQERNPRVAAQILADVELGRSILAQEESEWVRLSDEASGRDASVRSAEERMRNIDSEQRESREQLAGRMQEVEDAVASAAREREEKASQLDRPLRLRYDKLRGSRRSDVLVPAANATTNPTCTACFTAIPRSRVGKLHADGVLLDGCEMCGALIYLAEQPE